MITSPRKTSPFRETLRVIVRRTIMGQIRPQPLKPAKKISHTLIDAGRSEGKRNGMEGGSDHIIEIVRVEMDSKRKNLAYVVQLVRRARIEGRRKIFRLGRR
jgi:hypothetical protein